MPFFDLCVLRCLRVKNLLTLKGLNAIFPLTALNTDLLEFISFADLEFFYEMLFGFSFRKEVFA